MEKIVEIGSDDEMNNRNVIDVEDGNANVNDSVVVKEVKVEENEQNDGEKKGGKPRSWVWDHFVYVKGAKTVQCPYCSEWKKCDSINGTGGLIKHLKNHCSRSPCYKRKEGDKQQSLLGFKPTTKGQSGGSSIATHSFSQDNCRKAIARMCIKDNRPFSVVDDEGFRGLMWEMNPLFAIPSRWTVARDCLGIYKEEASIVKNLLKNQTISLTTDTWSSVQNINYMCLTAHWIDDDWVLKKKILNFCPIANHKGETIGKLVYACLQKWGIDRVFTITVDNASSNDGAIRFLKNILKGPDAILDCKYMHLRCCAHIVNLVVRDGLEEQDVSIAKIRNAVRYVRSSPAREASFRESAQRVKIDCKKKLCLDVETRWNSTFLMLETAENYIKAFERLEQVDNKFKAYFGDDVDECDGNTRKRRRKEQNMGPPSASDWEKASFFIEYLRMFYNVTNLISGSKYLTSNLFFGQLVTMHASISNMCLSLEVEKKKMALSMKAKYDKYWDNIDNMNFLLYVAVVLDPRNKMVYLAYCLGQIHGVNSPKTKDISDRVVKTLIELYDHYKMRAEKSSADNTRTTSSIVVGTSNFLGTNAKVDLESSFLKYMEEQGCVTDKTEVEIYLTDAMEKRDEKFDVLGWWKVNALKFPILSLVARHILGMPISTVASESAFSTGGRIIDPFRSSLTPKTAEALICSQDWIRSTSIDIGISEVQANSIQELQEKLEKIEIDAFSSGPKFFTPYMVDD